MKSPFLSSPHTQVQHSRRRDSTTRRLPRRAARNNRFQHVSFPTIINFLSPRLVPSLCLRVQSNYPISSYMILAIPHSFPFPDTTKGIFYSILYYDCFILLLVDISVQYPGCFFVLIATFPRKCNECFAHKRNLFTLGDASSSSSSSSCTAKGNSRMMMQTIMMLTMTNSQCCQSCVYF